MSDAEEALNAMCRAYSRAVDARDSVTSARRFVQATRGSGGPHLPPAGGEEGVGGVAGGLER